MGTISDKLTYLSTTKSQLKDMINYGLPTESQITSSTTFRNYVSSIFEAFLESLRNPDTLFTNLPKTTGTGTQITLNNTANAPMRIELNPTAISQDGTPTPDNPQDIHTINGYNSVVVEGKNLFDKDNVNFYNGYPDYGAFVSGSNHRIVWVKCKPNTTYTVQKANIGSNKRFALITSQTPPETSTSYTNINKDNDASVLSITSGANDNYLSVWCFVMNDTAATLQQILDSIQIELGTTATEYELYKSQTAPIDLGKNLFDKNNAYVSGNNNQDIAIQLNDLKVGTKYKFYANGKVWLKILTYDSNSTLKRTLGNTNQTKVIEFYPQSGETSFYFSFYAQNNVDISTYDFTNVYIFENDYELGTIGNYKNRIFKNIPTDEDYSSERDEGGWYYKQGIGKVVLDGTEGWYLATTGVDYIEYGCTNIMINGKTGYNSCITNYFSNSSNNRCLSNRTSCLIRTPDTTITTDTAFKTWLSTHNTIVYYPLATPTYTKITGELANQLEQVYKGMLSYSGQTNISQVNNDLPFTLDVSAIEVQ